MEPIIGERCFICGNDNFVSTCEYIRCRKCGHEIFTYQQQDKPMLNEILPSFWKPRIYFLDRFKCRLVKEAVVNNNFLLDVGCGNGSFIFHARRIFNEVGGVEICDIARDFAIEKLTLIVKSNILDFSNTFSFVTAWHSLEHMTTASLLECLRAIYANSSSDMRFIVSVPNTESLQYRFFRGLSAFYDKENHVHQFSVRSLDTLLCKFDFFREKIFTSFLYNIFGYLQSFLNIFNPIHNYLYKRKKRGEVFLMQRQYLLILDCYNSFLVLLFIIPAAVLASWEAFFPLKGGIITLCYKKTKKH